ncbi:ScbR family autoregulator-binding transcription factor [Kitasatospora sp. NPDC101183]|uniref:ScbR family autoregulator-binding transcription factor n=1 Tax=Kitasatospora sp. NPDC101183 TaxID=3364100 RepID=UPI00381F5FD5
MAVVRQERAVRTRRLVLEAAATVFDEHGFEGATIGRVLARAGVTRGALYFHFASKRELARGVLAEQFGRTEIPQRHCRLQEFVDLGMLVAHLVPRDPMLGAGARLSLGRDTFDGPDGGAAPRWIRRVEAVLTAAAGAGELLPHVVPAETAWLTTGAWTGVRIRSQRTADPSDLERRVAGLYRHLLPGITVPGVLASLDLTEDRGARVAAELAEARTTPPRKPDARYCPAGGAE